MKTKTTTTTTTEVFLRNLPVFQLVPDEDGKAGHFHYEHIDPALIKETRGLLSVDWEGRADQVLLLNTDISTVLQTLRELDGSWFEPCDKGGYALYGLDHKGKVIWGMTQLGGNPRDKDPKARKPHICIAPMDAVKPWN